MSGVLAGARVFPELLANLPFECQQVLEYGRPSGLAQAFDHRFLSGGGSYETAVKGAISVPVRERTALPRARLRSASLLEKNAADGNSCTGARPAQDH
jgi:hypothetical protein